MALAKFALPALFCVIAHGDYQDFVSQYAGNHQSQGSAQQGSKYEKYMKQYAGEYQKYMKQYAGEYQKYMRQGTQGGAQQGGAQKSAQQDVGQEVPLLLAEAAQVTPQNRTKNETKQEDEEDRERDEEDRERDEEDKQRDMERDEEDRQREEEQRREDQERDREDKERDQEDRRRDAEQRREDRERSRSEAAERTGTEGGASGAAPQGTAAPVLLAAAAGDWTRQLPEALRASLREKLTELRRKSAKEQAIAGQDGPRAVEAMRKEYAYKEARLMREFRRRALEAAEAPADDQQADSAAPEPEQKASGATKSGTASQGGVQGGGAASETETMGISSLAARWQASCAFPATLMASFAATSLLVVLARTASDQLRSRRDRAQNALLADPAAV
eukprot:CAMPEP_0179160772 /NCGR_PEP_ID=MMETSP0796-20121207/78646_1 /TAXON_ID=73915 /ORGANISM="Pyrodinium bahamense, Strain pbaha01" /LENGTH=389 /DNA_ID=CAMNT_0020862781 /DNA_START=78 /DNA_END=1247 /DNA_ORIENTATION=+